MKLSSLLILLITYFSISPLPAFSQAPSAQQLLESGRTHLEQNHFQEAFVILSKAFRQEPDNPEINFELGVAASNIQDYETAAMAFERVLITNPDIVQAKLELAKAFYRLGAKETAREYFEEVIRSDIPENVKKNIENFLNSITMEGV